MAKLLASPRLQTVVDVLGPPETDAELDRWTWHDGDTGVFVDKLTYAWQTVAWTAHRSVTLRTKTPPTDGDLIAVATLAGLAEVSPTEGRA